MMTSISYSLLVAAVAYLCGSMPTGYWLGKLLKGIDIREHGSRSTGATNVLRTLGKLPAIVALMIDLMKGVAAVAFARWVYSLPEVTSLAPRGVDFESWRSVAMTVAGLLAVIGHSRSMWIGFTGGKSAATGLGVLLAMSWQVGLGVAMTFCLVLLISRIVSLSSICSAAVAVVLMAAFRQPTPFLVMAIIGSGYVIWRHQENIRRLFAGVEPRVGRPVTRVDT